MSADENTLTPAVKLGKEPQSGAAVTGVFFEIEYRQNAAFDRSGRYFLFGQFSRI